MPLPEIIHQALDMAIQNGGETDESQFYGLYTLLLSNFFPPEEEYMVVPQCKPPTQLKSVNFTPMFIVRHKFHPVFFVEIGSSGSLRHISSRGEADLLMRERFKHLPEDVEIGTLYGASAFGTKICMYKLDRASHQLSPSVISGNPELVTDTAPIDRWNIDIMTPEGEEELRKVVLLIKEMSCRLCR